ncbi:uncharacterized protein BDV14DRAFT_182700 [Aspergillus stella-maris]|uniref:uncharacterized protein n=1 Tax=Aspergillus stella-maris TaxID=1810926 RepID=UPI003CCD4B1A
MCSIIARLLSCDDFCVTPLVFLTAALGLRRLKKKKKTISADTKQGVQARQKQGKGNSVYPLSYESFGSPTVQRPECPGCRSHRHKVRQHHCHMEGVEGSKGAHGPAMISDEDFSLNSNSLQLPRAPRRPATTEYTGFVINFVLSGRQRIFLNDLE